MPWTEALGEGRVQAEQWRSGDVHKRLPVTLILICPFSGLSNPAQGLPCSLKKDTWFVPPGSTENSCSPAQVHPLISVAPLCQDLQEEKFSVGLKLILDSDVHPQTICKECCILWGHQAPCMACVFPPRAPC